MYGKVNEFCDLLIDMFRCLGTKASMIDIESAIQYIEEQRKDFVPELNKDHYQKEIVDIVTDSLEAGRRGPEIAAVIWGKPCRCDGICDICDLYEDPDTPCRKQFIDWANSPYRPEDNDGKEQKEN